MGRGRDYYEGDRIEAVLFLVIGIVVIIAFAVCSAASSTSHHLRDDTGHIDDAALRAIDARITSSHPPEAPAPESEQRWSSPIAPTCDDPAPVLHARGS